MIAVKDIVKKYGEKKVLSDVTFDFPKGKIIAFIGSNGAGKSTLLSIITRTLQKNNGSVILDDRDILSWKNKEVSKRISILKQSNNINIKIRVEELVEFGRFPHCGGNLTDYDRKEVDKAIEYMGIEHLRNEYIDELSGGQRQMAYIAMVIAQDTEYIFLDEPLNNLDMQHSVKIMKILRKLVDEKGKTIMVVIHDINFVSCYSDYIVAMKNGKIINSGNINDMMTSQVLEDVYNMPIDVKEINNKKVCLYYN